MTRYLLDTNIISDLVRAPQGRIADRIRDVGQSQVCTSIIVAAEMRFGAARRGSPRLTAQVDAILRTMEVLPLGPPADALYGALRARLEQGGQPISGNDLLIAAHAIALNCTVVTDNQREFTGIAELPTENWLRDEP